MVWLRIDLDIEDYTKIIKHIHKNMFLGVKRLAPNLQHLVIHSVGDNLDLTGDLQNIQQAEIFLEKKIEDSKITVDNLTSIIKDSKWHIRFACPEDEGLKYEIVIDKKSDLIEERDFTILPWTK